MRRQGRLKVKWWSEQKMDSFFGIYGRNYPRAPSLGGSSHSFRFKLKLRRRGRLKVKWWSGHGLVAKIGIYGSNYPFLGWIVYLLLVRIYCGIILAMLIMCWDSLLPSSTRVTISSFKMSKDIKLMSLLSYEVSKDIHLVSLLSKDRIVNVLTQYGHKMSVLLSTHHCSQNFNI